MFFGFAEEHASISLKVYVEIIILRSGCLKASTEETDHLPRRRRLSPLVYCGLSAAAQIQPTRTKRREAPSDGAVF